MTNEEAIKNFTESLKIFGGEHAEAMKVAIKALKKQIPKKPIGTKKNKGIFCPCCGRPFPGSLVFLRKRCWDCGQKVDWSEVEND